VALRTVESARQAAESGAIGLAVHVGHHLIGQGRADLETDVAYRPGLRRRARRFVFAHVTAAYLGAIGLLTALLLGLGFAYAQRHADSPWPLAWVARSAAAAGQRRRRRPSSEPVRARLPRRRRRFDFMGGVPEARATMVVVPTLLPSVEPGLGCSSTSKCLRSQPRSA
jgi:cyclic beta-1,2-glucan synthetase